MESCQISFLTLHLAYLLKIGQKPITLLGIGIGHASEIAGRSSDYSPLSFAVTKKKSLWDPAEILPHTTTLRTELRTKTQTDRPDRPILYSI